MSIDEMLEVIQAYKDGKQIQARGFIFEKGDEDKWIDVKKPNWDFSQCDYRIKLPDPVSIKATEEELEIINNVDWYKRKWSGALMITPISTYCGYNDIDPIKDLRFNHENKCWEEWGEE